MTEPSNAVSAAAVPGRYRAGRKALAWLLVPALAAVGACSTTEKYSYLDGERWVRSELNTFDTVILSVDGRSYTWNSRIRVDPGPHHIVFQTAPAAGFRFSPEKSLDLVVEPCTRYWFEARRGNRLEQDFEPRVNYQEPIAGCGVPAGS
jgi:hypothetical protein